MSAVRVETDAPWRVAVAEPALLGESPVWHAAERCLYYCDIAGREVRRFDPATGALARHAMAAEPASLAPMADGSLLVARRDGLWRFDPQTAGLWPFAPAPYDAAAFRFNDGKCDPAGRFWVGTLSDAREPLASLYRCTHDGRVDCMLGGIAVGNGLGWSPDGRTMYWSDTKAHTVHAAAFDAPTGTFSSPRVFAQFEPRRDGQALAGYGGRPDGAAVDAEGAYWVAMYEGARLLRLSPRGEVLRDIRVPVQCPTMPCFGGADLRTLYLTTVRDKRPPDELAGQPWAGCVLSMTVEVPGIGSSIFE